MESITVSGLSVNDISDHPPVSAVHGCNYKRNWECNEAKYGRVRSEESVAAFRNVFMNSNWKEVCEETDVNKASELFLDMFENVYIEKCPIKQYGNKNKYSEKTRCQKKNH